MGELTYGALGAVPMIIAFWPILFGGAYGMTKRREAMSKAAQEKDRPDRQGRCDGRHGRRCAQHRAESGSRGRR